jgi:cytochrome c peroxidase
MRRVVLLSFFLFLSSTSRSSSQELGTPYRDDILYPSGREHSNDEIVLGKTLFFDTRLSLKKTQSCNTCHNADLGFGDALRFSVSDRGGVTKRNTPHLYNLGWNRIFNWDGRASSLEEQVLGPIQSGGEMDMPLDLMLRRLKIVPWYREMFKKVYGENGLAEENVASAIAAFERSLVVDDTPFDRFLNGMISDMSPAAIRGMGLFEDKAQCMKCHNGVNLTDQAFHVIGLKSEDPGRGAIAKASRMRGAFKTPGLRNVLLTAPYMHDGSLPNLEAVIEFYDRGGDGEGTGEIEPLGLTASEKRDLIAFLGALTQVLEIEKPQVPADPAGLSVD